MHRHTRELSSFRKTVAIFFFVLAFALVCDSALYLFGDGERPFVFTCDGSVLNNEGEFAGVAKRYALKRSPDVTSIAIVSSQFLDQDDGSPARYLFELVLYQKARVNVQPDRVVYRQDWKNARGLVSICADVMQYSEGVIQTEKN